MRLATHGEDAVVVSEADEIVAVGAYAPHPQTDGSTHWAVEVAVRPDMQFPEFERAVLDLTLERVPKGAPEWLTQTTVSTPNGTESNAMVAADIAHVVWAVNLGCLGFHVWPSRAADPGHADELRIDLDPQPGVAFDRESTTSAKPFSSPAEPTATLPASRNYC